MKKVRCGSMAVVLVVMLVAGVAVAIYFSDVWRTKAEIAYGEFARWTPQNIVKDPDGYLVFCEDQTLKTIESAKAAEIQVAQNRGRLMSMCEDAQKKQRVGTETMVELKTSYRQGEKSGWPIEWREVQRSKDWVMRQIVGLDRQIKQQEVLAMSCKQAMSKCDADSSRAKNLVVDAAAQLNEIKMAKQTLKVRSLSRDLQVRLIDIRSVLSTLTQSVCDLNADLNVDQLAEQAEVKADKLQFESIMKTP